MGCTCVSDKANSDGVKDIESVYGKILQEELRVNRVVVFTSTNCEKSKAVKEVLKSENVDFEYFDLDKVPEGKEFLMELQRITLNQRTPFLFYDREFVGGVKEVQGLVDRIKEKDNCKG